MPNKPPTPPGAAGWTFLTDHARVLLCLARDPEARVGALAGAVGIAERAVRRILADLEASGYVTREREGRRDRYHVRPHLPLRHLLESHRSVGDLVASVGRPGPQRQGPPEADFAATLPLARARSHPASARPRAPRRRPSLRPGGRRGGA